MKISKFKRGLSIFLAMVLIISVMPLNTFANTGTTNAGFEAVINITSEWGNNYSGNITIKNNSTTKIENWKITFESEDTIESIWDAEIVERSASSYIVKNKGWNANINPGGSVSFGFNARTDGGNKGIYNIKQITDTGSNTSPDTLEDSIFFTVTSDWGTAFNAQIEIKNTTATVIENWSLVFDFNRNIGSIWNATIIERVNGRYTLANAGWNAAIPPGGFVIIGFDGTGGNVANDPPKNFVLHYNGKTNSVIPTPTAAPVPTPARTLTPTPTPTLSPIKLISDDVFPSELFKDNTAIPSIKLSSYGDPDGQIEIREGLEFTQLMDENPLYIGKVIDIQLTDAVVEGEISFDLTEDRPFNEVIICRIDPVTGQTLPLETALDEDGNIAAELDGGGRYFVMDLEEFFDYLDIDLIKMLDTAVGPQVQQYNEAKSSFQLFDSYNSINDGYDEFDNGLNIEIMDAINEESTMFPVKLEIDTIPIQPETDEVLIFETTSDGDGRYSAIDLTESFDYLEIDLIDLPKPNTREQAPHTQILPEQVQPFDGANLGSPLFDGDNDVQSIYGINGDEAHYILNPDTGETTIYEGNKNISPVFSPYSLTAFSEQLEVDVIFIIKATASVMNRKDEFLSLFEATMLEMEEMPGVSAKFMVSAYGGDSHFDIQWVPLFNSAVNTRRYANNLSWGQGWNNFGYPLFSANTMLANFNAYGRGGAVRRVVLITDDDIRNDRASGLSFNRLLDSVYTRYMLQYKKTEKRFLNGS